MSSDGLRCGAFTRLSGRRTPPEAKPAGIGKSTLLVCFEYLPNAKKPEMQVNYDAESIRRHADALDDQADRAGIVAVVIWGLIGLFFGALVFYVLFERYQALAVV